MKIIKYLTCFFFFIVAGTAIISCTKEDDYKEITKDGEIYYPGRADSVAANGGRNRIQLRIILGNDPLVTKVKVFWKNNTDSVEANVVKTTGKDVVDFMFNNLTQGAYSFEVYTYTANNARSIVKKVTGTAYGDNYQRALSNRTVKSIGFSPDGNKLIINWNAALDGEKSIELKYTDEAGLAQTAIVPGGSATTELPSYKNDTKLVYRSIFLPEPKAIDEFTVDQVEIGIPAFEREVDKANFKVYSLPTDVRDNWGWLMEYLWNKDYDGKGFASTDGSSQWFTFDMGESVSISRFKTWQAADRIFRAENVKKFEIWGSNSPASDGSWESWTKLAECQSVKPSGLPVGQTTDGDINYAKAGEEFKLPPGTPKARYIRIKVLETWGGGTFITMGELTFWTSDRIVK
ncbi:hypothetical protein D7322_15000 [Sphingobacterium puteale]|uniref:F5/8 type C domain-containing protein n=1 Tax=Sphingobacterium puteale TaxID=2420510 RepID=A0A420VX63_9SPHI|nr:DUF4998 domain-containing protein [Sphingobacterium puteale]RKO70976.1 hypothetical protein D7322_15000 [Sphingobacterium puteale]